LDSGRQVIATEGNETTNQHLAIAIAAGTCNGKRATIPYPIRPKQEIIKDLRDDPCIVKSFPM
jgi:hypothetical protein